MVMEEQENPPGLASESIPVPLVHDTNVAPAHNVANPVQKEGSRSKPRYRKKVLHAMILKQMEFYFGDANLSRDIFLINLLEQNEWVDLEVFLQFNKIRTLTQDVSRIAKALKTSTLLEVSENGLQIRRLTPVKPREDCEACSVYVQGLPPDADHDWLISIFSRYGEIDYVSIPKYKTNKKIKGFAFIEFKTVESAQKCLKAFGDEDCTLPSHTSPHELLSITTFSEDDPPTGIDNVTGSKPIAQDVQSTRKNSDSDYDSGSKAKRTKFQEPDKVAEEMEKGDDRGDAHKEEDNEDDKDDKDDKEDKDVDGKKKKRKRKRRARAEQPDIIDFGLRIMAKKDWKKLRNRYLELQREKMKQLKQHLRKTRWNQYSNYDKKEIVTSKMEVDEGCKDGKDGKVKSAPKFTFSEGLIVKIELDEPCTNQKIFKNQFRSDPAVQYVDIREGSNVAYIRYDTTEGTRKFVENYSDDKPMCVLSGDEERIYWEKMAKDREEKLGKKDRPKQRGRDKLLKKAEKELGKHIKFDEV